ncbi:MAG: type II toxin-antitoxin system VapC family toxin [Ignavibacteriaceae bacterium]|nr:type II toxin-antitoxin system VapC family toxin [Ignavibacterium sp.]MCC6255540.1 type II toxin-antitoxin system VapC family toxin [Ignavibacteriaceae bacterium]HRN27534.1 type II toxin-antitoxin system VapC family toxin [Ignavibacteriaceae bacterium]HRP91546.1 type II toxin-antitoxin system VapC family toxin [Ignavibacteriaceae bacterium]HRQ53285.1 type II toxin-antitoxin system VapC family toxin [Ignavibacteriaceae bacterium]
MSELLIIDTDILIDIGRNNKVAIERLKLEKDKYELAVSVITEMELVIGCRNKTELKYVEQFLEGFEILSLNLEISRKAVDLLKQYRLSHGLLIADSLIAAKAIIFNAALLTKNQKDFKFIKGLRFLKYP